MTDRIAWLGMFLVVLSGQAMAQDSSGAVSPGELPGPVYLEQDGLVVVEAEDLPHSDTWELRDDPGTGEGDGAVDAAPMEEGWEAHTGDGYLRWTGGNRGVGHHNDPNHQYLGQRADWLVLKVNIIRGGVYNLTLRNFHQRRDGDNDVWVTRVGVAESPARMVDVHTNAYTYLDWTSHWQAVLEPGLNTIVIAGRSEGFGIDRIVLYQDHRSEDAKDPGAEVSPTVAISRLDLPFTIDAQSGFAPHTVSLKQRGSFEEATWDFGDGSTRTGNRVEHRFAAPGTYRVKMTGPAEASRLVHVLDPGEIRAEIPHIATPPTVDGEIDALWNDVPAAHVIDGVIDGEREGDADASARWRAAWGEAGLYVLMEVRDDRMHTEGEQPWERDSVEVYVDADGSRYPVYDGRNDSQYIISAADGRVHETKRAESTVGVETAVERTDDGYRVEVHLPWPALGHADPRSGQPMGLEVRLNDEDNGQPPRDAKLGWTVPSGEDLTWRDPCYFSVVRLGEE